MSQPRYNPRTQRDDWYYRIKESFRDLTGRVRSRVMLNVGFIDEPHRPEDIRDIGKCLTYIHEHQGEKDLFGNPLSRYNGFVQRKTQEFWQEMVNNGSIDAVKATMEESRKKAERLVDVNTIEHTDAREIGAEWVCLQAIRELEIDTWNAKGLSAFLRKANKNVIINSRIQGYGDYATPEQGVPVVRPQDKHWELCMTTNDSWGYQHADTNYKSPYILLRTFVDCLSMGGNMLLDIGPKEDGTIPEEQVAILKEFGRWTKKHKEAIYDTRAGIPNEHFQGYTTLNKAGDILYLYLPYKPNGPIEVKGLMNKVNRVWVVGDGAIIPWKVYNKNYWSDVPGNLYIDVPERSLDPMITVVAVLLDGPIKLYRGAGKVIESN